LFPLSLAATGLLTAGALFYGLGRGKRGGLVWTDLEFISPRLPKECDGVRLWHVSDIHVRRDELVHRELLGLIDEVPADLLCFTGDLVGDRSAVPLALELMKGLCERYPTYMVLGNHDYCEGVHVERLRRRLTGMGVCLLLNRSEPIPRFPGLRLVGLDDPHTGRHDLDQAFADVEPEAFVILLAHSPAIHSQVLGYDPDLVLCGHTHGGQICLPLIGPIKTNARGVGRKAVSGFTRLSPRTGVYVSRGIGVTYVRTRILCSPEITRITLRRGSPGSVVSTRLLHSRPVRHVLVPSAPSGRRATAHLATALGSAKMQGQTAARSRRWGTP